MKKTNFFLAGAAIAISVIVSTAVLAAPPGPPPTPNTTDANFSSINLTNNLYDSASYLSLGKTTWSPSDLTGSNMIHFSQPIASYNSQAITGAYTATNCTNDAGIVSGGICWFPLIIRDEEGLAMTSNQDPDGGGPLPLRRQTNLLLNSLGGMSNPKSTGETNPTCTTNGGLWNGGSFCDYPISVNDFGGLRINAVDPEIGWFYANTKIDGYGMSMTSTNNTALDIRAQNETGMYHADLDFTDDGLKVNSVDLDLNYSTTKDIDMRPSAHVMQFRNATTDNYVDPGNANTWYRGAYVQMDGVNSILRLGAKRNYMGNYKAISSGGSPIYLNNFTMDNETDNAYLYMNMYNYGDMYVSGQFRAPSGIGQIYKVQGPSTTVGAGLYYGFAGTVSCNSTAHRMLSCALDYNGTGSVVTSQVYTSALTGVYSCNVYGHNPTASTQSARGFAMCFDPGSTTW